jgi:prolyl 4-hydroxylase
LAPKSVAAAANIASLNRLPPFSNVRALHIDPLVLTVQDFLTDQECDRYIAMSSSYSSTTNKDVIQSRSRTVGKDTASQAQRTSTTWFHKYKNVPELMAKASRLLGLEGIDHWEEPQTVRYRRNEKFTWHLDALAPDNSIDNDDNLHIRGGQRIATLLVYLTDMAENEGGATMFRDLRGASGANGTTTKNAKHQPCLSVRPQKGTALLFFPSAGGIPGTPFDIRALHCGQLVSRTAMQDKWIAQLWLRQLEYSATAPPDNDPNEAVESIDAYCLAFP